MSILKECEIKSIKSRVDNSWDVSLNLNEMSGEELANLNSMRSTSCKVYLTNENVVSKALKEIDSLSIDDTSKSPSQRLRNVLYVLWEQDKQGYETFTLFYNDRMERIINQIKDKLE